MLPNQAECCLALSSGGLRPSFMKSDGVPNLRDEIPLRRKNDGGSIFYYNTIRTLHSLSSTRKTIFLQYLSLR